MKHDTSICQDNYFVQYCTSSVCCHVNLNEGNLLLINIVARKRPVASSDGLKEPSPKALPAKAARKDPAGGEQYVSTQYIRWRI